MNPLQAELAKLIGREHVLAGDGARGYETDESHRRGVAGRPDAVVLPGTAEQVRAVVEWCYGHEVAMVPRGGGTGLVGGAVAMEGGVVVSVERMRAVRELSPELWRMYVEAGVRTGEVRRLARENGLLFGPDPGAWEQSQIGGNVATNAGGPHALKYGVTGSWVAGLEVVLAPGELIELGGWARKDVGGYDLKSLMIGSEGTLGVITAVRLRLLPAPEERAVLVVFHEDRRGGCGAILEILAAGIQPSALDFIDGVALEILAPGYPGEVPAGAGFALIVEVDGGSDEVAAQVNELRELLEGGAVGMEDAAGMDSVWRWRDGANGTLQGVLGGKVSEDVVFPVERLEEGLERFQQIGEAHGMRSCGFGHGGDGNVHATVLVDPAREEDLRAAREIGEELFALVIELGGSIAGEHGIGWVKGGRLEDQWPAPAIALHEEIKRVFDPKGLFNPGKKLARLPPGTPQTD
jgi:glycolate oxidase subunit GlcD